MEFAKMQGVGNDFVVVSDNPVCDLPDLATRLCERKFSIGADGLLVIGPPADGGAFSFRMFNPDGTEDMCGNGLRCAALWARRRGLVSIGEFSVATKDGLRQCELISAHDKSAVVRVNMGEPHFALSKLPMLGAVDSFIERPLEAGGTTFLATVVNTGSTHTTIFGDQPIGDSAFFEFSPQLENHPIFPERTSVMWTEQTGKDRFSIRIWERGAGETLGCGTGACAAAVAAVATGRANRGESIDISSKGGELTIRWTDIVWMTGPAEMVFEGVI